MHLQNQDEGYKETIEQYKYYFVIAHIHIFEKQYYHLKFHKEISNDLLDSLDEACFQKVHSIDFVGKLQKIWAATDKNHAKFTIFQPVPMPKVILLFQILRLIQKPSDGKIIFQFFHIQHSSVHRQEKLARIQLQFQCHKPDLRLLRYRFGN